MGGTDSRCCEPNPTVQVKTVPTGAFEEEEGGGLAAQQQSSASAGSKVGQRRGPEEAPVDVAVDLAQLQGCWLDKSRGDVPLCTIQGSEICWEGRSPSQIETSPSGELFADVDGRSLTAKVLQSQPVRLLWSDGGLWVRDELQGHWSRGGEVLGFVRDGFMHWGAQFDSVPSELKPVPVLPQGQVSMSILGERSTAVFHPGPPARLCWDDGEVWHRSSIP